MRFNRWLSPLGRKGIVLALLLASSAALVAFAKDDGSPRVSPQMPSTLEASVFSYDGQDFVRTQTTLMTEAGKSAVNTKLERDTPAFKALAQKHSYTGDVTVFGKHYNASYAPLTDDKGQLTGALFVGTAK